MTLLLLGGFMALMFRKDYRQAHLLANHAPGKEAKVNG
jgi:hypothetical protein